MTPSGKTPIKSTVRSVVRQILFIPGTNEIALGSSSLARAFATSQVACTLIGVRFWQTHCSGNIKDAVGATNCLETRKSHVSFHVSGFIARLLMAEGRESWRAGFQPVVPSDTDRAAAHPARARGQLVCYVNT